MPTTHRTTDISDPRSPAGTPHVPRLPILKALTSVRFFAALHVALYHLVRPYSRWGPFTGFMSVGYSGVSFFFFLSGFILTYAHAAEYERGKGDAKKFWLARFARIYPVYFVSMVFAGYVGLATFKNHIHIIAYIADLLMLQAWSVNMVNFFNFTSWTLSCEAFFYLVFPFLLMKLRPRSLKSAVGWIALFFLLSMAVPALCLKLYPGVSSTEYTADLRGSYLVFNVRRLPILALPEFLSGVSLGWLFLRFKPRPGLLLTFALAGTILTGTALLLGDRLPFIGLHNGLLIPFYSLLLLGLSGENWLARLLSGKFLVLLGEASFSLYIIHVLVSAFLQRFGVDESFQGAALNLSIAIPLAILMHIFIERPCRRLILRWWAQRHPAQLKMVA